MGSRETKFQCPVVADPEHITSKFIQKNYHLNSRFYRRTKIEILDIGRGRESGGDRERKKEEEMKREGER